MTMAKFTVDDQEVEARDGLTLLEVFRSIGVHVPTLCHHEAVSPYGACRLCLVEVSAGRRNMLTASCMFPISDGIIVQTATDRVIRARRMVAELLLARCPDVPRVQQIARDLGVEESRFPPRDDDCVLCGLCVRGCSEIAGVGAIDFANRGSYMELVPPFKMDSDTCVGCTTCVYLCPTGCINPEEFRKPPSPHRFEESMQGAKCSLCVGDSFRGVNGS